MFFSSVLSLFQNSSNSNNNSKGKDNAERSSASINNCIRCTHSLSFSRTFYLRAFIVVFPSSLSQSTLTGSVILDLSGALPCAAFPLLRRALFHVVVVITQSEQVLVAFLQLLFRSVDDVAPPTRPFFQARRQAASITRTTASTWTTILCLCLLRCCFTCLVHSFCFDHDRNAVSSAKVMLIYIMYNVNLCYIQCALT